MPVAGATARLSVADAATFSSIGHTPPTGLAEQAATVFL